MSDDTGYKLPREAIKCGHCGSESVMYVVVEKTEASRETEQGTTWRLLRCPSCFDINIFQHNFVDLDDYDEHGDPIGQLMYYKPIRLYPSAKHTFSHLPQNVAKAYEVALKTYSVEPIAFAVLVGRMLEFLCRERNAKGKDLNTMLNDLANRGEIPKTISDMAHGLRFFRNISAHASDIEVSQEDATVLRDLCETILEYVYEAPSMLKHLEERISQMKQKNDGKS
jgi:uncharacterized protein DUF4145